MNTDSSKEMWDTYLETFDHGKTGSKTFRIDLINEAPLQDLNHLLIAGTKFNTTKSDGFPEGDDFELLHQIGDELIELLNDSTKNIMVGSFLYDGERLEYFYIQNPNEIIAKVETLYKENYPDRQFYITIKEDKDWKYYKEFLFPQNDLLEDLEKNTQSVEL